MIIYHFLHVHEEINYNILIKLLAFGMWTHKDQIAYNLTGGICMFNVWILCFFEQINLIGQRNYGMKMLCIIMGYKVMSMH